ncbi:UNKNOWN [Stylonychia lemnae]|uniref:Uncharacterized protein n=1 Tax=Stylonychia lemnae TaxID=5949 RepID=A0A078AXN9_STYLE|nr:UNKNOWN [Stylonychia lemnae]|eukprot:CDW86909.1 UNKNOWN [Stylonychia lemnae]
MSKYPAQTNDGKNKGANDDNSYYNQSLKFIESQLSALKKDYQDTASFRKIGSIASQDFSNEEMVDILIKQFLRAIKCRFNVSLKEEQIKQDVRQDLLTNISTMQQDSNMLLENLNKDLTDSFYNKDEEFSQIEEQFEQLSHKMQQNQIELIRQLKDIGNSVDQEELQREFQSKIKEDQKKLIEKVLEKEREKRADMVGKIQQVQDIYMKIVMKLISQLPSLEIQIKKEIVVQAEVYTGLEKKDSICKTLNLDEYYENNEKELIKSQSDLDKIIVPRKSEKAKGPQ